MKKIKVSLVGGLALAALILAPAGLFAGNCVAGKCTVGQGGMDGTQMPTEVEGSNGKAVDKKADVNHEDMSDKTDKSDKSHDMSSDW